VGLIVNMDLLDFFRSEDRALLSAKAANSNNVALQIGIEDLAIDFDETGNLCLFNPGGFINRPDLIDVLSGRNLGRYLRLGCAVLC